VLQPSVNAPDISRLRVLLVPDSIYWVLGTIAKAIARYNPWIEPTIVSGPILDHLVRNDPGFFDRFDLVHFICPYVSRDWLPTLKDRVPVVTSHHHVTDWSAIAHNMEGDAIVVGAEEWGRDVIARGASAQRVVRLPYGVDSDLFVPATAAQRAQVRTRLGLAASAPIIGFFAKKGSNDDDRKGVDISSKAAVGLRAEIPEAGVLIVGPGWQELVDRLRASGVRCAWVPFVEDLAEVAGHYHALDFYWVTARVEGGPVPLLEAMSSEVCCLTTAVGLAREIVEDRINAVLVPMNDAPTVIEQTVDLWSDVARRRAMGKRARETIVSRMHIADTLQGVRDAYKTAVRTFADRNPGRLTPDIDRMATANPNNNRFEREAPFTLCGLTSQERKRIPMVEALAWSENLLLYQRQRGAALKLILKAWRSNPFSIQPVRVALRRFLPPRLVASIVRAKRRLTGEPARRSLGVSRKP